MCKNFLLLLAAYSLLQCFLRLEQILINYLADADPIIRILYMILETSVVVKVVVVCSFLFCFILTISATLCKYEHFFVCIFFTKGGKLEKSHENPAFCRPLYIYISTNYCGVLEMHSLQK